MLIAHKNADGGVEYLSTVMRDMTERRQAEEALRISQQKLLETSRLAGMAEVATGVLHNVGNVLNSVNVSAGLVVEKLRRSKAPKLAKAAALLTKQNGNLGEYLTKDVNGQKLPGYLAKLGRRAALEVWAEHQNEIDLLLTDVVMPESISGRELAHTLVMDKPDLKVIFTSGYSAELIGTDFEQEKRHAFLAKPYLPDRLAQTVAAHLQSQPAMTASHTPVLATA